MHAVVGFGNLSAPCCSCQWGCLPGRANRRATFPQQPRIARGRGAEKDFLTTRAHCSAVRRYTGVRAWFWLVSLAVVALLSINLWCNYDRGINNRMDVAGATAAITAHAALLLGLDDGSAALTQGHKVCASRCGRDA